MKRSLAVVALVLGTPLLTPQPGVGQAVDEGIRWTVTSALPPGTVGGVVLEASTGRVAQWAVVQVYGTDIGTLSNSEGQFRLEAVPVGRHAISIQLIGYESVEDSVEVREGRGVAVRAAIAKEPILKCGLIVCGKSCGAVRVNVRDVLTGVGPRSAVALRVRRDTLVEWSFAGPERERSHVDLAAGEGDGPFVVEVAAAGYVTWRKSDVRVERNECDVVTSPPLPVWLLPVDQGTGAIERTTPGGSESRGSTVLH